jgi:RNase P subunit RPR2
MHRYADPGVSLFDLATHYVVACPKCAGKALVKIREEGQKLVCTSCFHTEIPGHWYGSATAYVSVKCRECHHPMQRSSPWNGLWKKLAMRCDQCGDACEYEAHITRHAQHEGRMTDAVYGLPLWLQAEFREELFWAFHYEHLEILEHYIAAKHRERGIAPRNTIKKNSAMLSRLPAFITRAGNREALLKLIKELSVK